MVEKKGWHHPQSNHPFRMSMALFESTSQFVFEVIHFGSFADVDQDLVRPGPFGHHFCKEQVNILKANIYLFCYLVKEEVLVYV